MTTRLAYFLHVPGVLEYYGQYASEYIKEKEAEVLRMKETIVDYFKGFDGITPPGLHDLHEKKNGIQKGFTVTITSSGDKVLHQNTFLTLSTWIDDDDFIEETALLTSHTDESTLLAYILNRISSLLPESNIAKRALALMLLSGDASLKEWCAAHLDRDTIENIEDLIGQANAGLKDSPARIVAQKRMEFADSIVNATVKKTGSEESSFLRAIGRLSMHPFWGMIGLAFVLFCFYKFVGEFGAGTLVDFFEEVIFGVYLSPGMEKAVKALIPFEFVQDFLVGQYGLFTMALTYAVAIILPITATFFIAFGFLEDSGYLPRIAVLSNSIFSKIGLNGKAVLPMVLGLGCGTMATMTTRILETKRERIIATFLIALAIPCSAQLGVIMGILGGYSAKVLIWWLTTVIFVLLLAGAIAARVLPGEKADFFLELPPIRIPRIGNILIKTVNRIEWYLKEAVPLFLLGTSILFFLDKTRVLDWLERIASPVIVTLLGLPAKATGIFIMGFLRRDYGAAGIFDLAKQGLLSESQLIVSIITLTLFMPCMASFFMIIKERGLKTSLLMLLLITFFALTVGGTVNLLLKIV